MKNCIYKIISISTGKFYIGSAKDFKYRKSVHLKELKSGKHHNIYLSRHYNKYGLNDLQFEIIECGIEVSKLLDREQHYLDTLSPSFNICKKAGSRLGIKITEETRERLRVSHIGISHGPHSEKTKQKIKESNLGRKHTDQERINISNALKDKKKLPFSDIHRINMSKSAKGKKKGPQSKIHIDKRVKYLYGNSWNKGKENRNIPVVQLKNGLIVAEYKSAKEAAKYMGTSNSNIIHAIKGRIKKAKGYEWKYKKDITSYA